MKAGNRSKIPTYKSISLKRLNELKNKEYGTITIRKPANL